MDVSDKARTELTSWQALVNHAKEIRSTHMRDLFLSDNQRFNKFSIKLDSFLLDYSKNLITDDTFNKLLALASECDIEGWREKMFSGKTINTTENRAVLHTALRNRKRDNIQIDGKNITDSIQQTLSQMKNFSEKIRQGIWRGCTGKPITDIVNIGVGGSNLGPEMITEALTHYGSSFLNVHFVSNVDGSQIANILKSLSAETVLFIVSSKTFTTSETITNAKTARKWLLSSTCDKHAIQKHFVAVSADKNKAIEFGIEEDNIFSMWDWVGGRFSLWSAIGLPIAIYLGFDQFIELLNGASEIDSHFYNAPLASNAPVILALISVWNCTFLGAQSQTILPYDQALHMLPAYLQQAEMESNGKSVTWNGDEVTYPTVPCLWGEIGINGQHAFYQYLHQSNNVIPADFIGSVESTTPVHGHHKTLMSNFFAQTQALMQGVNENEVYKDLTAKGYSAEYIKKILPHKLHKGNRPSNSILLKRISPKSIGSLIALYEHKIFVQGVILQICSFDQWGVELGKSLAKNIHNELENELINNEHDCSTEGLINYFLFESKD